MSDQDSGSHEASDPVVTEAATERAWVPQLWWTVVGLVLIDWAFQTLGTANLYWWTALGAVLAGAWGIATIAYSWLPARATPRVTVRGEVFAWITAVIVLLAMFIWALNYIHNYPGYGTDELAFDQYAGELVRHGLNPYVHSMRPSYGMYSVSPGGLTYTLTGQRVDAMSYPSLAFLIYVPFLALGWSTQLGPALDVIGWGITVLLMFRLLPRAVRPLALVIGSIGVYTTLAVIGLTDMLYLPFLVLAAYKWDRFGTGWRSYSGPVLLGVAMAFKQTPWLILPFVLVALAADEYTRAGLRAGVIRACKYLVAVVITFLIPNIPYIVASPHSWFDGAMLPVIKDLVPSGQGLIGLSLYLHIGGGSLAAYTALMVVSLVFLLVFYVGTAPLLRGMVFALPVIVYLFAARSFAIYLVALIPAGLIGAVSCRAPSRRVSPDRTAWGRVSLGPLRSREWLIASAATFILLLAVMAYAFSDRAPLELHINKDPSVGSSYGVTELSVRATNRTSGPLSPHFVVQQSTDLGAFWHIGSGPRTLAGGQTAEYTLLSPDASAEPQANPGFNVVAFTSGPSTMSVSAPYLQSFWHFGLTPVLVDSIVPTGRKLVVKAQLLSSIDAPIRRPGVHVRLVQPISHTLTGATGHAIINGGKPGAPGYATTNRNGQVMFTIVGTRTEGPVAFLAQLVHPQFGYSGGFSTNLDIRFRKR